MRRLPSALPPSAVDLVRWAEANNASRLAPDMVPGAQGDELGSLAALGAVARALAPDAVETWPEPVADWARSSQVEIPRELLQALTASLKNTDKDVLASAYEQIVSGVNRRRLGTFFTPAPIVDHMINISRSLIRAPDYVVDPGAGVGAFSLAALKTWKAAKVLAIDVNVVTLGLLAARSNLSSGKIGNKNLILAAQNYLSWITEAGSDLDGSRLILGNPPYTRNQQMTRKEKNEAQEAAGDLVTSGLAGLSAYFLAATIKALRPRDALCLLLPGSWCETRYGREIRQWLWAATNRPIELHFFPSAVAVFPGTQVTAMVLVIGQEKKEPQPFILREVDLRAVQSGPVTTRRTLYPDRMSDCPSTFTEMLRGRSTSKIKTTRLGDFIKVRRGVATGASSFFFLTDASRAEFKIPRMAIRRALIKPAHCKVDILTRSHHDSLKKQGLARWLLDLNGNPALVDNAEIRRYLEYGMELGAHLSHLAQQRRQWHTVEFVPAPDLFISPVGRREHRVISNMAKAVGSNNLYGLYLREGAPWEAVSLAAWLRSEEGQSSLGVIARQYQGGSLKIEPKALGNLAIPLDLPRVDLLQQ